jgi:hypothetical protein
MKSKQEISETAPNFFLAGLAWHIFSLAAGLWLGSPESSLWLVVWSCVISSFHIT